MITGLVVAACGGGPTTSANAGATASLAPIAEATASPAPIGEASATPDPDPCRRLAYDGPWTIDALLPGSAVEVVVPELELRAGPCEDAQLIETLQRGDILIVLPGTLGPLEGDGLPWYAIARLEVGEDGKLPPLSAGPIDAIPGDGRWIAANDGSRPYVRPLPPRCPDVVDLGKVSAMLPAERLLCLDGPTVLEGTFGSTGCGGSGGPTYRPLWLAGWIECRNFRADWAAEGGAVTIYFKPDGPPEPRAGSIIRVTVHVDDPASQRCTLEWTIEEPPITVPDKYAIPYCQERMVVESYEVLGTDPHFPLG